MKRAATARLRRLRAIAHRAAAAETARAEAALAAMEVVADRVIGLRADVTLPVGACFGRDALAHAELALRLDAAQHSVQQSLAHARIVCTARTAARVAAHWAETRINEIDDAAAHHEAVSRERSAAAALPPRRRPSKLPS